MNKKFMYPPVFTISTVERDTGFSKDTLRVWERRYGFPSPARDNNGERVYPADQLDKLRVIRRLMDSGLRPGKVVSASLSELNEKIRALPASESQSVTDQTMANEALRLLTTHQAAGLHQLLSHALMRRGLHRFVLEVVAPLNELVGRLWIEGQIEIFEEHLYAEQIQQLLRHALGSISHTERGPRILLTTLPGEQHKIGLLMAEACFSIESAQCISLGVQTPVWDIVQAALVHRADIVALSCRQAMSAKVACAAVADLRQQLDPKIELWVGGNLWKSVRKPLPGVNVMVPLTAIPLALEAWRDQHLRD